MFMNEEKTDEVVVEETKTEEVVEESKTEEAAPAAEEVKEEETKEEAPSAEEAKEETKEETPAAEATEETSEESKDEEVKEEAKPAKKAERVPVKWDIHPNPFTAQERRFSRDNFEEKVVQIRRVVKTTKGGRNFKFAALVVIGDKNGKIGFGQGKSKEVPEAIKKAIKVARRNISTVFIGGSQATVAHELIGKSGAAAVMLKPAKEGTGVIASDVVRAVVELAGYRNIYTKIFSKTHNPQNIVKAVVNGLTTIEPAKKIAKLRDIKVSDLIPGLKEDGE